VEDVIPEDLFERWERRLSAAADDPGRQAFITVWEAFKDLATAAIDHEVDDGRITVSVSTEVGDEDRGGPLPAGVSATHVSLRRFFNVLGPGDDEVDSYRIGFSLYVDVSLQGLPVDFYYEQHRAIREATNRVCADTPQGMFAAFESSSAFRELGATGPARLVEVRLHELD
jgi:hypothetical protein